VDFNNLVAQITARRLLPQNSVEGIQELIEFADPSLTVPNRKKLSKRLLPELARKLVTDTLLPVVHQMSYAHLSVDLWMKFAKDVFGIYLTGIVPKSDIWEIAEFCLGTVYCPASDAGTLQDVLQKTLNVEPWIREKLLQRIFSVVADGGENIRLMTDNLGDLVHCRARFPLMPGPLASRCQLHLIHDVAKDATNSTFYALEKYGFDPPAYDVAQVLKFFLPGTRLLKKSSPVYSLWIAVCRENELPPLKINNPVKTRWLYLVSYLVVLLYLKPAYNALWLRVPPKHRKHSVPEEVWLHAEVIVKELLPLWKLIKKQQRGAAKMLLSESVADVGNLYKFYKTRVHRLLELSEYTSDADNLRIRIVDAVYRSMKSRYAYFEEFRELNAHYVYALLLDPRSKSLTLLGDIALCRHELAEKDPKDFTVQEREDWIAACEPVRELTAKYREKLLKDYIYPAYLRRHPSNEGDALAEDVDPYGFDDDAVPQVEQDSQHLAEIQFAAYKKRKVTAEEMSKSPLEVWPVWAPDYPEVAEVAQAFLSIPKAQTPVEGQFSIAEIATAGRRSNLSMQNLNMIIFCHQNLPRPPKNEGNKKKNAAYLRTALVEASLPDMIDPESLVEAGDDLEELSDYQPGAEHGGDMDYLPPIFPDINWADLAVTNDFTAGAFGAPFQINFS
jgi:hypothetical protein